MVDDRATADCQVSHARSMLVAWGGDAWEKGGGCLVHALYSFALQRPMRPERGAGAWRFGWWGERVGALVSRSMLSTNDPQPPIHGS